jgi:hypothetical protein
MFEETFSSVIASREAAKQSPPLRGDCFVVAPLLLAMTVFKIQ